MKKVLVAYASKYGYTAEAAGWVADVFKENNLDVDLVPAAEVQDIAPYEFVLLCTAVKGENVVPEAAEFNERFRDAMRGKPAAYFALSMYMADPSDENRKHVAAILNKLRFESRPWDMGIFGGVRDPKTLSRILTWSVKAAKAPVGDFRNPGAIKEWAERLAKRIIDGKPY
jgi:menaquinone-dependent protoporphyrinogen oxidase